MNLDESLRELASRPGLFPAFSMPSAAPRYLGRLFHGQDFTIGLKKVVPATPRTARRLPGLEGALIVEDIKIGPRHSTSFGLKDELGREVGCDHWIERDDDDPTYLDPLTYSGHVQPTRDGKNVGVEIARGGWMCWNGAAFALDNMIEAYRAVCEKKFGGDALIG